MTFKVTILGSGSALPMAGNHHSAHALNVHEQFYLIDCGEGTQSRLMRYGINPMKLRAVFLSHMHGDHIYGIFPLISTLGLMGRKTPLKVFAPSPFGELMETDSRLLQNNLPFEIQYTEINTREHSMIYENSVMEVFTIPLRHRVPASGFLFKEKRPTLNVHKDTIERYGLGISQIVAAKRGDDITADNGETISNDLLTYRPYEPRSYAYCSDTMYSGKVSPIVSGVDLFYHEATFAANEKALARQTGHSTTHDAAKAAKLANAGRLLIGHLSGRYKSPDELVEESRQVFPETYYAQEGMTFEIPLKKHL